MMESPSGIFSTWNRVGVSASFRVESALEHGSEYGRAYLAPVEVVAGVLKNQFGKFVIEARNLHIPVGKKTAVAIRECLETVVQIRVTLIYRRIEHFEQLNETLAHLPLPGFEAGQIVVKHAALLPENPGIFRIEAENQSYAQDIEASQSVGGIRIDVLPQKFLVNFADNLACLQGDFHLLFEVFASGIYQKLQAIVFRLKVFQLYDLRLALRILHIIDIELAEIAHDRPARTARVWQFRSITLGLLEWGEDAAVRLFYAFVQVLVSGLLLNQHVRRPNVGIDEAGAVELDLILKGDDVIRPLHSEHRLEEFQPERLAFAFLISLAFPMLRKGLCRGCLLILSHSKILMSP